jgi:hypothetical protein
MGTPPEQLLISAILREGDFQTHQAHGITAEHFHDYRAEWRWLETHFQTYGHTPTKTEFRNQFEDFTIKRVNTIGLYCAEVQQSHKRHAGLGLANVVLDLLAAEDYDGAESAIVRHAGRVSLNGSRVTTLAARMIPGGSFILDGPSDVPSVWGHGQEVLWAEGEPFVIVGPDGVGKTTVAQQVALALVGIGGGKLLGYPVAPVKGRVLYLACDRPAQARRSMRRMIAPEDRAAVDERLRIWKGPPPADFGKHPGTLLDMARAAGADAVIVDSLKDVALGLTEDEVGAGVNQAHQLCAANGVEVCVLHHQRKTGTDGGKPKTLTDVYGSRWITAGAGSVVLVWANAGDAVVEWSHLKQPAEPVGPFKVQHDHTTGTSAILDQVNPVAMAESSPGGITVKDFAVLLFDKESPSRNEVELARRRLGGRCSLTAWSRSAC